MSLINYATVKVQEQTDRGTRERLSKRMEGARSTRGQASAPPEPLGCAECGERFSFGERCPGCDLELVPLSLIDQVDLRPAPPEPLAKRMAQIFAVSLAVTSAAPLWLLLLAALAPEGARLIGYLDVADNLRFLAIVSLPLALVLTAVITAATARD